MYHGCLRNKTSGFIINISKQQAFETKKFGWIMTLTLSYKRIKFAENVYRIGLKIPCGYGDL